MAPFSHSTRLIGSALTRPHGPVSLVGGGDTVAYVESSPGLRSKFSHVSTGGGSLFGNAPVASACPAWRF